MSGIEDLREYFNVGAGGAANALGKIINKRVYMNIPRLGIMPVNKVLDELGDPDKKVCAVYFDIKGGFNAGIVIIFETEAVLRLASMTLKNFDNDVCGSRTVSFLKEISNIMSSYFLNNFSKFVGKSLIPSVPAYSMDMLGAIMEELFASYGQSGLDIMFIETVIFNEEEKIFFDFLLIPDSNSLNFLQNKANE